MLDLDHIFEWMYDADALRFSEASLNNLFKQGQRDFNVLGINS